MEPFDFLSADRSETLSSAIVQCVRNCTAPLGHTAKPASQISHSQSNAALLGMPVRPGRGAAFAETVAQACFGNRATNQQWVFWPDHLMIHPGWKPSATSSQMKSVRSLRSPITANSFRVPRTVIWMATLYDRATSGRNRIHTGMSETAAKACSALRQRILKCRQGAFPQIQHQPKRTPRIDPAR